MTNSTVSFWTRYRAPIRFCGLLLILAATIAYFNAYRTKEVSAFVSVLLPSKVAQPAPARPKLIATFRDVPPEMIVYSSGRHAGPLRTVIEEAANRIGYDIEWKSASFAESVSQVTAGSVDIVPSALFKTPAREKVMRFSVSLGRVDYEVSFLQHNESKRDIKSLDDLAGRTVGYRRAVVYFDSFESLTGFKRVGFSNDLDMMKAFADRAVDVVVVNNKRAASKAQFASGINSSNYKFGELTMPQKVDLYFLFSRSPDKQEVFDRLDQALLQMKNDNVISDIYQSFNVVSPVAAAEPGATGPKSTSSGTDSPETPVKP